jgi:predicted glycosyltransferase
MRLLVDVSHPAHVHLFKHFIWEMEKKGHTVKVTARDKEVTRQLLDAYGIPYVLIGKNGGGTLDLALEWINRDWRLWHVAREFQPDILLGNLNPAVAHAAKLTGKTAIIFSDMEPEVLKYPVADLLTSPFADVIISPSTLRHDYGEKGIRVDSYKELAYLHPHWFTPNGAALKALGPEKKDNFVVLRFVAWTAYHDVGEGGFNDEAKQQLIEALEPHTNVFISSEAPLPPGFAKYALPVSPEKMHDLLAAARLVVCDSQTVATESAILGTPAIRCNSFVGENDMSNFIDLEKNYGLIYNCPDANSAIQKAVKLMENPDLKNEWAEKRAKLLEKKIDFTSFLVWFVEHYPQSVAEMKGH